MRRIVTGEDERGAPTVLFDDDPPKHVDAPQAKAWEVWVTDDTPPDLLGRDDAAQRPWTLEPPAPRGSAFRLIEFQPGGSSGTHSTATLDYVVILSGTITLTTGGREFALEAGDVVVQRGAPHDWTNNSSLPCLAAVVLISAAEPFVDEVA
jgi:quercetin dioxygenase-like cupin family protein